MFRRWITRLWAPRCPYEPPPDTPSSDEERREFEAREREIEQRLAWIREEFRQLDEWAERRREN